MEAFDDLFRHLLVYMYIIYHHLPPCSTFVRMKRQFHVLLKMFEEIAVLPPGTGIACVQVVQSYSQGLGIWCSEKSTWAQTNTTSRTQRRRLKAMASAAKCLPYGFRLKLEESLWITEWNIPRVGSTLRGWHLHSSWYNGTIHVWNLDESCLCDRHYFRKLTWHSEGIWKRTSLMTR
jgi:hypothetical protein